MSAAAPVILHAGALGDLILTLHLSQRLPAFARAEEIEVYTRFPLGPSLGRGPCYRFFDLEGSGATVLYRSDGVPSEDWRRRVGGRVVLNALSGSDGWPHRQLVDVGAARVMSLDPVIRGDTGQHVVQRWMRRLARDGHLARDCSRTTRDCVSLPPEPPADDAPLLVLHPGSGGAAKCWPLACFEEVAGRWRAAGGRVLLPVGEVERERWADVAAVTGMIVCETRPQLVDLLRRADVYVGNDSGPTHLAAWLGRPTVALFGPTDPATWRPLGPRVSVLRGLEAGSDWGLDVDAVSACVRRFAAPRGAP